MSEEYTFNTDGLDRLIKSLKVSPPTARVGVLGGKDARRDDGSNATIGMKHEFGDPTAGLPSRSWLRIPIKDHLQAQLEDNGAFDKDSFNAVIKEGSVLPWITKVAITAWKIVLEGFASGGYGKWKAWSPGYKNNTGMILVDSQQLRDSVTWDVKS